MQHNAVHLYKYNMGLYDMAGSSMARKEWTPNNPFQKWAYPRMVRQDMRPIDMHREILKRGIEVTESYLYRVLRQKHRSSDRVGYDLAYAIGEILGDVRGALEAAGYKLPADETVDETTRLWVELYSNRDAATRQRLLSVVQSILDM